MKREIKFRAWDTKFGVMLNDIVVYSNDCIAVPDVTINESYGDRLDERLDDIDSPGPEWYLITNCLELMQFTGLKDKNGDDIYEGDIVQYKHGEQGKEEFYLGKDVVSFHNGGFKVGASGLTDWYTLDGKLTNRLTHYQNHHISIYERDFDIEVIGNIHQHPELLTSREGN